MRIARYFTTEGKDVYASFLLVEKVLDPDDFSAAMVARVEVPAGWGDAALSVFAEQVLCRTPIPNLRVPVRDSAIPQWLWRHEGDAREAGDSESSARAVYEFSVRQVFDRVAGAATWWGWHGGYFDTEQDAAAFHDELRYLMLAGIMLPDLAVLKTTGLYWAYGLKTIEEGQGTPSWFVDHFTGQLKSTAFNLERPLPYSGFIISSERNGTADGISNLPYADYAMAVSSKVSASVTDSFLQMRSPIQRLFLAEIEDPISQSLMPMALREQQAKISIRLGARLLRQHLNLIMAACDQPPGQNRADWYEAAHNSDLAIALEASDRAGVPLGLAQRAIHLAKQGYTHFDFPLFDDDSGALLGAEKSHGAVNFALRLGQKFLNAVVADKPWFHGDKSQHSPAKSARQIWDEMGYTMWSCNQPTLHFRDPIQDWHTCPNSGEIAASVPSGDLHFLDHAGRLAAQINPLPCLRDTGSVDVGGLEQAVRLSTLMLEIFISMAGFPQPELARQNFAFRPLALSPVNLPAFIFSQGKAYDSAEGRALAAAFMALITGVAYATSAELAEEIGSFTGFNDNRAAMLRVLRNHQRAVEGDEIGYEKLSNLPCPLIMSDCVDLPLLAAARRAFERAVKHGEKHGFRNAQVSVIAPVDGLSALFNLPAHGLQPLDLAGLAHSHFSLTRSLHPMMHRVLKQLGYKDTLIEQLQQEMLGHLDLTHAPCIHHMSLRQRGFTDEALQRLKAAMTQCSHVRQVFQRWVLGDDFLLDQLRLDPSLISQDDFDLLACLGFSETEIEAANSYIFGMQGGLPSLREEHQPLFAPCQMGTPQHVQAQLKLMRALQPFVSGAIAEPLALEHSVSIHAVQDLCLDAAKAGLKLLILHRDGANLLQPHAVHWETLAIPESSVAAPRESILTMAETSPAPLAAALDEAAQNPQPSAAVFAAISGVNPVSNETTREKLPDRRKGYTQKASIDGHKIYVRTGEYEDGRLGEIFIDMNKEGAAFRSLINNFAIAISMGLQYGVPLEEFVDAFTFTRFEPNGVVEGNEAITMASSILDYVFRELAISYLGRKDLAQVQPHDVLPDAMSKAKAIPLAAMAETLPADAALEMVKQVASTGYVRGGLRVLQGGNAEPAIDAGASNSELDMRLAVSGANALNPEKIQKS